MEISIVSPVYKAENVIDELVSKVIKEVSGITNDFEIILVEDGSSDNSWSAVESNCKKDPRVKGIKLSRNFGQHYATTAGLDFCSGKWVVIMDCDLQDPPEEIHKLYSKALEGYDVVLGKRSNRKDSFIKKFTSRMFFAIFNYLSGMNYDHEVGGFRIVSRKVVNNFCHMREHARFCNGLIEWMGFPTAGVYVEHGKRTSGKSSYNFKSLWRLASDWIVSYSDKPLRVAIKIGFFMSLFSFIYGSFILLKALFFGSEVTGWSSLIVSMYFLSGIIITILGILGLYLGKTFTEIKNRPLYVVHRTSGFDDLSAELNQLKSKEQKSYECKL